MIWRFVARGLFPMVLPFVWLLALSPAAAADGGRMVRVTSLRGLPAGKEPFPLPAVAGPVARAERPALTEDLRLSSAPLAGRPAPRPGQYGQILRQDGRLMRSTWARLARDEILPRGPADWFYLGGLGAASVHLSGHKGEIREVFLSSRLYRQTPWVEPFRYMGDWPLAMGAAGIVYTTGLLSGSAEARETGLLLGESLAATGPAILTLQFVLSEERPGNGGGLRLLVPNGHGASGHAATSMVVARVLDYQFLRLEEAAGPWGRTGRVLGKVGLYAIPALTALQRVRDDRHYFWNVILGGGVALFVTNSLLRAHRWAQGREASAWAPDVAAGPLREEGIGFRLTWGF